MVATVRAEIISAPIFSEKLKVNLNIGASLVYIHIKTLNTHYETRKAGLACTRADNLIMSPFWVRGNYKRMQKFAHQRMELHI